MFQDISSSTTLQFSKKQSTRLCFELPTCNALRYFQYKYRRSQYFEAKRIGKFLKFTLPIFKIN